MGVGKRLFFLHDGSAANLVEAIRACKRGGASHSHYQGVGDSTHNLTAPERQNADFSARGPCGASGPLLPKTNRIAHHRGQVPRRLTAVGALGSLGSLSDWDIVLAINTAHSGSTSPVGAALLGHDRYQGVQEGCLNPSRAFAAAAQVDCRKAKSLRHLVARALRVG